MTKAQEDGEERVRIVRRVRRVRRYAVDANKADSSRG
jgi:hypothetical protein